MKDLKALYAEWREVSEQMIADGIPGDVDCGYGEIKLCEVLGSYPSG